MAKHQEIYLSDYTVPDFLVEHTVLDFDIRDSETRVTAKLDLRRNSKSKKQNAPLFLNGEDQKLLSLTLNGKKLGKGDYKLDKTGLTIPAIRNGGKLEIVSSHNPHKNTSLNGLYASGSMLSTQCESHGFRRITFYPDRPDVMSKFRVIIHADKKKYPVLLSNGNLVEAGAEGKDRHFTVWEDPFRKPCYLFALVAGKLDKVSSSFTTKSKRNVRIEIYVEPGKTNETAIAMAAIKKSMKWDEQRYGLEYDLDRFMIVATPFFNMGAMENKGPNIFNDSCLLGRADTATDGTIEFIERVVGHEYFHNWTGDRITCRDWFQLSLKEGLTVFREQEFMGDMHSIAVERLGNVRDLRRGQFAEDAGPMAHSVRPDHYQSIDNFYTSTVYDKGSEVVRMIQTLVGRDGFRKGMDLYVKRHDGQAVTCDDFVKSMADANRIDLSQFMLWYAQAGTPVLAVKSRYDAKRKTFTLEVVQSCPSTPKQPNKKPMHIPLAVGLLDKKGKDLIGTKILSVKKSREIFKFKNIASQPVPSLLRDFSAPVRLIYPYKDDELLFLLGNDSDSFNRWEAAFKLSMKYLLAMVAARGLAVPPAATKLMDAMGKLLRDPNADAAFKAMALSIPSEGEIGLALRALNRFIDPEAVSASRKMLVRAIGKYLRKDLLACHAKLANLNPMAVDGVSMGKRSLKNLCLAYLAVDEDKKILDLLLKQVTSAKNMTDQVAALSILSDSKSPLRQRAFVQFEKRWSKNQLVMDRWLATQASARHADTLKTVQKLLKHPSFDIKNPNRVSALIGVFAGNLLGFHNKDGSGYRFIAEMIKKIDAMNPQSAARLVGAFARWRDYESGRRALMQKQLKQLKAIKKLSPNCHEIVGKSLAST